MTVKAKTGYIMGKRDGKKIKKGKALLFYNGNS